MDPMKARDMPRSVAHMFNVMDAWRHLPGYRLEGRLAPYFEVFLHDMLGECLGVELDPVVIPEFPLRKGTLDSDNDSNQSYNVDYVAFSKKKDRKRNTVFFVELKTNMSSIGGDQKTYLCKARKMGLRPLVDGIIEICKATDHRMKYAHLLHLLASLELVSMSDPKKLYQASKLRSAWRDALESGPVSTNVEGMPQCARVIYIQPRKRNPKEGFEYIYFKDVANIVQRNGDLGCIFANFLRQWTKDPGQLAPRTVANPH